MASGYGGFGTYGGYGRSGRYHDCDDGWCDYCGEHWDYCECDMTVDSGGRQPSTARDNIAYTPPETMNSCPLQWCSAFWHGELCDDYRCDGIHLCRFFVQGRCMFESFKCWSGHSLRTLHNSGVLRRCGMDHMSDDAILDMLYETLNTGGPRNGDRVYYEDDSPPRWQRRKHHQRRRQQQQQQQQEGEYSQNAYNYHQQQQTRPQQLWPRPEARQQQPRQRPETQQQQQWPMPHMQQEQQRQRSEQQQQQQRQRSEPQQWPIPQMQQQQQQQGQPATVRWTGVLQFQVGPQQPPMVELLAPVGPERRDQLQQPAAAPRAAETPCKPSAAKGRCSPPVGSECRRSPPPEVSEELQCAVCLGTLERATTLGCGHSFCAACVDDVRRVEPKCPICRVNIKTWTRSITLDNVINSLARKC